MLIGLRLGNFKAFADTQYIPIRPLTLIFGPNSAGKSSIIHSLLLAAHAMKTGKVDVQRTECGGDSVDLGGFRQYVYKHDLAKWVEWAATVDTLKLSGHLSAIFSSAKTLTASSQIGLELVEQTERRRGFDRNLKQWVPQEVPTGQFLPKGDPGVRVYDILADEKPILRFARRPDGKFQLIRIEYDHEAIRGLVRTLAQSFTTTDDLSQEDYESLAPVFGEIAAGIHAEGGQFLLSKLVGQESPEGSTQPYELHPISKGNRADDLAQAIRLYFPRLIGELLTELERIIASQLGSLTYLGPLRSFPPRHIGFSQGFDQNWFAGGGYAWDLILQDSRLRGVVNQWLGSSERLQTPYELVVRELVGLDQISGPLSGGIEGIELDIVQEGSPPGEHSDGEDPIWGIKDPESEAVRLVEKLRASHLARLPVLSMRDKRTDIDVSHRDVGIGISQVLPVLVYALASRNKLLAMEQPEIHVHPQLQAELGDVFITSALGEGKNTVIVETHSEHLILRIMRRMRETAQNKLDSSLPSVKPSDVSILYIKAESSGSKVLELRLDDEGTLLDPWPGGFFEEGFRERFA